MIEIDVFAFLHRPPSGHGKHMSVPVGDGLWKNPSFIFFSSPLHTHSLSNIAPVVRVAVFGAYSELHFLHCESAVLAFEGLKVFNGHLIHFEDPLAS